MSWDSYIDSVLGQSGGNGDKAAIIAVEGGVPWTGAHNGLGMVFQDDESVNIARAFKSKDFTVFQASGIRAEGVKYRYLREEDGKVVLGKLKDYGAITMQRSNTAIVIAHTKEGSQQGNVNKAVAAIAEYLEGQGM